MTSTVRAGRRRRCRPRRGVASAVGSAAGLATFAGSRMVKVEPSPGSLSTVMSPPIMLAEVLADGQAQPGAAVLAGGRGVGLGEGLEQLAELLRGHADAGVGHAEGEARLAGCGRARGRRPA